MEDMTAFRLPNGCMMPSIGFGTYVTGTVLKPNTYDAVKTAIDCGYRSIDTAYWYLNEEYVGRAIRDKIKEGVVERKNLFVTSKLWNCFHQPADVIQSCKDSLRRLGLDYLDLYLIHWPMATKKSPTNEDERDSDGNLVYDTVTIEETWKAMEDLVDIGLCKAIGLSNFNMSQIKRLHAIARHPISNLQTESCPYITEIELVKFCHDNNITVTAYSPLYRMKPLRTEDHPPVLMTHPTVTKIAEKHGKTPANIVLRFQIQRGVAAVPKSFTKERIISNRQIYDFSLSESDMAELYALNQNFRNVLITNYFDCLKAHPDWPF